MAGPKTERDEYDVQALRNEVQAMAAERAQERAELALLRAEVKRYEDTQKESAEQALAYKKFLDWVALSAEQKSQLVADKKFAGCQGDTWEVQLPEHPKLRLPGHSEYEAVGRYKEVCGIISTAHEFSCVRVTPAAA